MKKPLLFLLATLSVARLACADDEMRNVQTELKNQGFYYGELDGKFSTETAAA
jgi:peptidoglycan hydrolase-like protein with peptidoglycan-binding domain